MSDDTIEVTGNFGYHTRKIQKAKYGTFDKIREEFEEAQDAYSQSNRIMTLSELSDLYGAIRAYLKTAYGDSVIMFDLEVMADATDRAFESGRRVDTYKSSL